MFMCSFRFLTAVFFIQGHPRSLIFVPMRLPIGHQY